MGLPKTPKPPERRRPKRQMVADLVARLYRRRGKGAQRDFCTIYVLLAYLADEMDFTTTVVCRWDDFDPETNTVRDRPELTKQVREVLSRCKNLFNDLKAVGELLDLVQIRDVVMSDETLYPATPNVLEAAERLTKREKQRHEVGEIVQRTLWKNLRWLSDWTGFVVSKYRKSARLTQIRPDDVRDFIIWLKAKRNLANNTAQSTATYAKYFLGYCHENGWILFNPFMNFRRKLDAVERVTLTDAEMGKFFTISLESPGLEIVRKQFCLLLITGLNYSDLERLTPNHIKTSEKGDKYIDIKRRKTSKAALPPLNALALSLLADLWRDQAKPDQPLLTIQRNAPFNRSIRQIAFFCGIEKNVTSKVARNSLATYLVANGTALPVVAAILGHSSIITTTKFYVKTNPQTVIDAVKDLPVPGIN